MKDINMKSGWRVKHIGPAFKFTSLHNYDGLNEIHHFSVDDIKISNTLTDQYNCIGRWQPKGTKNKNQ